MCMRYGVGPDYFDGWYSEDVDRELDLVMHLDDDHFVRPLTGYELREIVADIMKAMQGK